MKTLKYKYILINRSKHIINLILLLLITSAMQAQTTLSDALRIALKKNYSIAVSRNDFKIADNNLTHGNAGFLPTFGVNFRQNNSINTTKQQFLSGQSIDRQGAKESSYAMEGALNWTIFDGFNMFASLDMLKELKSISSFQLALEIEAVLSQAVNYYFDIVRQNHIIQTVKESVSLSEERLRIIESKYELGSASKMEVLQAKVDLNADRTDLLTAETLLDNTVTAFNELLSLNFDEQFVPKDTILINKELELKNILALASKSNTALKIASSGVNMADFGINSVRSKLFPNIALFASYNHSFLSSESGFVSENTRYGLSYGLTLSLNIFDGLNTSREIENAKVNLENAELRHKELETRVNSEIIKSYSRYKNNLKLVSLEIENVSAAKEYLDIAFEQLRLGIYSPLELREAQKNYVAAHSRLISSKYLAKVSEKELLLLAGQILSYLE